jgi:hypothetical protein
MKFLRLAILFLISSLAVNSAHAVCEQYVSQNSSGYYIAEYNNFLKSNLNSKNISALQDRLQSLNVAILTDSGRGNNTDADFDRCMSQAYAAAIKQIESPSLATNSNQRQAPEIAANHSNKNENGGNASANNSNYQAPRGRCLALKVEGDSIMVVNHCGVPIVGEFCFLHSQLNSCADSTAGSFGPVGDGNEVMVATTSDTRPRSNELKYVLCNADAADHGQCQTHHP